MVDQMHNHSRSPCNESKPRLKDVYDGLVTSKELLKVISRVCHIEQQGSTALSLFSALKFELDRACTSVGKLILDQKSQQSDLEIVLNHFEKEKAAWKLREQDRICAAVNSVVKELNTEKKLRRQTEGLNKRLGKELADTKAALSKMTEELKSEKRTRDMLEQVCNELTQVLGEDRAEVEEMKKQSEQVHDELEKEREMFQLADMLREERVHMKLSEAKYQYEEKNAVVDELRNELESYLKSKRGTSEHRDHPHSPQYDKIKELEKYLRETLPGSGHCKGHSVVALVNEDENNSDIELSMDDISKSFQWNESKTNSSNRRVAKPAIEWEFIPGEHEKVDESSQPRKVDNVEDEMERYKMIKDLRDRIASGQQGISSKDGNGVACQA